MEHYIEVMTRCTPGNGASVKRADYAVGETTSSCGLLYNLGRNEVYVRLVWSEKGAEQIDGGHDEVRGDCMTESSMSVMEDLIAMCVVDGQRGEDKLYDGHQSCRDAIVETDICRSDDLPARRTFNSVIELVQKWLPKALLFCRRICFSQRRRVIWIPLMYFRYL